MVLVRACLLFVIALSFSAFAEESEETPSAQGAPANQTSSDLSKVTSQEPKKDIDQEITNAKMRAESGAKSKASGSATFNYYGGSVEDPLGKDRPNIYGDPTREVNTYLGGDIEGRYRFNPTFSMSLGTGVYWTTPLQGDTDKNKNQFNLNDPFIRGNASYKIGETQNNTRASVYQATTEASKEVSRINWYTVINHTVLYPFKAIKLTLGSQFQHVQYFYSVEPNDRMPENLSHWQFGIYPYLEYAFSDKVSVRSVFGYMVWRKPYRDSNEGRLLKAPSYQSVGVGFAVTRDIYLYPNIQFLPEDIAADKTNVALAATINI